MGCHVAGCNVFRCNVSILVARKRFEVHVRVNELLTTYRKQVASADLAAAFAIAILALATCGLVARRGTLTFRSLAVLGLLVLLSAAVLAIRGRRKLRHEQQALRYVLGAEGPLVERASRALSLSLAAPSQPGVSSELALLHYHRTLNAIDDKAVTERARGVRRKFLAVTSVCCAAVATVLLVLPNYVSEGVNVWLAREGVAPVAFEWLDYVSLEARLPAYLGNKTALLSWESAVALPEGTTLSVRGRPLHEGRKLVLGDGKTEVPFVDDGEGQAVAHWVVTAPVELRVGARFGDVLILESGSVELNAEPDRLPEVALGLDSRDVRLEETPQLEVRFRVIDDHQVSQVDLVLRALGREERRTLDRPAPGNQRVDGGYVLRSDDPFLDKAFVPVIARIEARDNKPDRGADEWGRSEAIILRPREVGAAQVQRYRALQGVVEALVDELATASIKPDTTATVETREQKQAAIARLAAIRDRAGDVTNTNYAGLEVPKGMIGFFRAQFEKALVGFNATQAQRVNRVRALERIILGLDAALATLAKRDAQAVSKSLGDVADEMAFAARAAQGGEGERSDALERLDLAVSVIQRGAQELRRLGVLGADLGSVAVADLGRVTTARQAGDFLHAELASLHMAARLHRPNPSFGAKGGGRSTGVEGGDGGSQGEGGESQDGPASDADEQFDRMARDLEELAQEHAQAVERSASALENAEQGLGDDTLRQEALRRAALLRDVSNPLPQPGEAPSTSRASAALAREHGIAMAHELEALDFEQAVESGQRARSAAEEALRRGDLDFVTEGLTREALREVGTELDWAMKQRSEWRARKEQAAKDALQEVSRSEQELSERTRRLASEGQQSQHGLPTEAIDKLQEAQELMRNAARQLGSGEGQGGLNLQRYAQRLLEEAQTGETKGPDPKDSESGRGQASAFGGDVPRQAEGNGAQDFRRRVLEGLARNGGGRLAPAVKRYAEGLLR